MTPRPPGEAVCEKCGHKANGDSAKLGKRGDPRHGHLTWLNFNPPLDAEFCTACLDELKDGEEYGTRVRHAFVPARGGK